jgi:hypothetical protein
VGESMGVFLRFSVVIDAAIGLKFSRISGCPLPGSFNGVVSSPNGKAEMFVCD